MTRHCTDSYHFLINRHHDCYRFQYARWDVSAALCCMCAYNIVEIVQKTTNLGIWSPIEEVRGGVEPWLVARWKARVEFLLSVIELLFLSLTVRRYKAKRVKAHSLQEWVGHFGPKFQGGRGHPWGIFFGFYKTDIFFGSLPCSASDLCAPVATI